MPSTPSARPNSRQDRPRRTGRRARPLVRLSVAAALILGVCVTVATPGAGASTLGDLLPFGCSNPLGHTASRLLPATTTAVADSLTCSGQVRRGVGFLSPNSTRGPVGYGPKDIQSAYKLSGKSASGRTVAIVDAYNDPKAESDLAVYRAAYGLPACTTANHCFRKVNQNGQSSPVPANDYGWSEEISLDLDAVSAACPSCHILLVEANNAGPNALMTAVDTAVRLGAAVVSNSYGGVEDSTIRAMDKHFNHPGISFTASTGDNGYQVQWPASSPFVTGVGGTVLKHASNARGWNEAAWPGGGSGCSKFEPKPTWQHDSGCAKRTVADVSAVADPATGLGIYDTFNSCLLAAICDTLIGSGLAQGLNGWAQAGGTSLSAPVVAAVYALAGNGKSPSYSYSHTSSLFDVKSGSNGQCSPAYLCTARTGYDGPTGLGTPNGTGAF